MRVLLLLITTLALGGCSTIKEWIPSFSDTNQSASIINVRQKVEQINCEQPQIPQVEALAREIRWFQLYSESKGSRQADVLRLVQPMSETTDAWIKRGEGSKVYCQLKKQVLQGQSARAAEAVLGRF